MSTDRGEATIAAMIAGAVATAGPIIVWATGVESAILRVGAILGAVTAIALGLRWVVRQFLAPITEVADRTGRIEHNQLQIVLALALSGIEVPNIQHPPHD